MKDCSGRNYRADGAFRAAKPRGLSPRDVRAARVRFRTRPGISGSCDDARDAADGGEEKPRFGALEGFLPILGKTREALRPCEDTLCNQRLNFGCLELFKSCPIRRQDRSAGAPRHRSRRRDTPRASGQGSRPTGLKPRARAFSGSVCSRTLISCAQSWEGCRTVCDTPY